MYHEKEQRSTYYIDENNEKVTLHEEIISDNEAMVCDDCIENKRIFP